MALLGHLFFGCGRFLTLGMNARSGDPARARRSCVCMVERNAETGLALHLTCSSLRSSVFVVGVPNRLREVGVRFVEVGLQSGKADDLAFVVNGACGLPEFQSSVFPPVEYSCRLRFRRAIGRPSG